MYLQMMYGDSLLYNERVSLPMFLLSIKVSRYKLNSQMFICTFMFSSVQFSCSVVSDSVTP